MNWQEVWMLLQIVHQTAGQAQFAKLHNAAVAALKWHQDNGLEPDVEEEDEE